ncbi:MAG: MarR family winged helix-turn-helix transcriptional regulator [Chloroflexota bacterium]
MHDPMAAIPGTLPGAASTTPDDPRLRAWRAFLLAQAAVFRSLADVLDAEAGLPLAEYDALVNLAIAPDRRLRMSELADRLVISRSGVTRLVDRLQAQALVSRSTCSPDGRGAYAVLTPAGFARLRGAVPVHLRHVTARFLDVIDPADLPAVERAMLAVAAATGRCTAFVNGGRPGWLDAQIGGEDPET